MSALDAGVFVLFTSSVGHLSLFPSSKDPDREADLSSMFPLPQALIRAASLPSSSLSLRSSLSLFPTTFQGPPLPSCSHLQLMEALSRPLRSCTICHPFTRSQSILDPKLSKHRSYGRHISAPWVTGIGATRACTIMGMWWE